ncbi:MAG: hypothetical protein ACI91O_000560 [Candidatus Poriferisodalaceae bacterium]|jgi:hypothetical protein
MSRTGTLLFGRHKVTGFDFAERHDLGCQYVRKQRGPENWWGCGSICSGDIAEFGKLRASESSPR